MSVLYLATMWALAAPSSAQTAAPPVATPKAPSSVGLEQIWQRPLGSGYAAPTVADGRVFAVYSTVELDRITAFDAETGKEIWSHSLGERHRGKMGSHDGPLSSPVVADGIVVVLSPAGVLSAFRAETGDRLWRLDLPSELAARSAFYGFVTSPIAVGGVVVVQAGSEQASLVGLDLHSGRVLWRAGRDAIENHSPVAAIIAGVPQIVSAGMEQVIGVDPDTGAVLWQLAHGGDVSATGGETIIPLIIDQRDILLSHREDASVMIRITHGDTWKPEVLWTEKVFYSSYSPPVHYDGTLYGYSGSVFEAVDAKTGRRLWRSRQPGDGFVTRLDGDRLAVISKAGSLHLVRASRQAFQQLDELELFDHRVWTPASWIAGRLWLRSMEALARVDLTHESAPSTIAELEHPWTAKLPTWVLATELGQMLRQLESGDPDGRSEQLDQYLDGLAGFPAMERSGAVHFLFHGPAEDVALVGEPFGFRFTQPMQRLVGTDWFLHSIRVEPTAAFTYGVQVDFGDPQPDPQNPSTTTSGMTGATMSLASMAGRALDPALSSDATEPPGELKALEWQSELWQRPRRAEVYLPADYHRHPDRRFETVYVVHGSQVADLARLPRVLDYWIGKSVRPIIVVFIESVSNFWTHDDRRRDMTMLADELVPLVERTYRARGDRASRVVAGCADAGQVALYTVFQRPEVFGGVVAQSATVVDIGDLMKVAEETADFPMAIFLQWGTYHLRSPLEDWDMGADLHRMWDHLRRLGHRPLGGETAEGMGWYSWRHHNHQWLRALFPLAND